MKAILVRHNTTPFLALRAKFRKMPGGVLPILSLETAKFQKTPKEL
jgi:hypothetical protein